MDSLKAGLLLAYASYANAQYNHGGHSGSNSYSSSNNPYSSSSSNSPFGNAGSAYFSKYSTTLIAHAVLATLAFSLLFPLGGIVIRIASFPGLWWIHGVFQTLAYILYIAAFALGLQMVNSAPAQAGAWKNPHPILGTILFVALFFSPISGYVHHVIYKKTGKRSPPSYSHIWVGRVAITLGIINGGLGLWWAQQTGFFAPPKGAVIGYAVVSGLIWIAYVAAIIYGERKRKRNLALKANAVPTEHKDARASRSRQSSGSHEMTQYA